MAPSPLRELIVKISDNRERKCFGYISDIGRLLDVLEDIDAMIALDDFKVAICYQMKKFTANFVIKGDPLDGDMMNFILYGPPGSGKTECGKALAKLWSLCLNKDPKGPIDDDTPDTCETAEEEVKRLRGKINHMSAQAWAELMNKEVSHISEEEELEALRSLALMVEDSHEETPLPGIIPKTGMSRLLHLDVPNTSVDKTNEDPGFRIITRGDVVGKYQGWSVANIRKIMEESKGGTIFVDEAYTLCTSRNDSFGMEVLTEINNFMDKNPDDVRWIFAGYKDSLDKTIFSFQPGLRRRFPHKMELGKYNGEELSLIFRKQLIEDGIAIDEDDLTDIPIGMWKNLPDLGGSTKNLCHRVKEKLISRKFDDIIEDKGVEMVASKEEIASCIEEMVNAEKGRDGFTDEVKRMFL